MSEPSPDTDHSALLRQPAPWPFSWGELTAGLRRWTGDSQLQVTEIVADDLRAKRPSIGRIRGLKVTCRGERGERQFNLALKEPQGSTRTGTAGVGLREASVYQDLVDQLPLNTPRLIAAHPLGDWLLLTQLPPQKTPSAWGAEDYLKATDLMVALHDRFWDLGPDLTVFAWLARPLDSDFDIYVSAAAKGVKELVERGDSTLFARDPELGQLLGQIVVNADRIIEDLKEAPTTLIHGDFWPGNIRLSEDARMTVYDWQQTGIGPSTLDLVTFIQSSHWWFDPLPLPSEEIIAHYRRGLYEATGHRWSEADWTALWDASLLWTFLAHWIDLVAAIPESLIETRYSLFEAIWLDPLKRAAARRLPGV